MNQDFKEMRSEPVRERIPDRDSSRYKGPEMGMCLACLGEEQRGQRQGRAVGAEVVIGVCVWSRAA